MLFDEPAVRGNMTFATEATFRALAEEHAAWMIGLTLAASAVVVAAMLISNWRRK